MKKMPLKWVAVSLISSYMITGLLLLFTAFLLYKLEPERSMLSAGIIVIYVTSTFFGGLIAGKGIGQKKYLWGFLTGCLYFLLLLFVSEIGNNEELPAVSQILTVLALCLGGGALGGMFA